MNRTSARHDSEFFEEDSISEHISRNEQQEINADRDGLERLYRTIPLSQNQVALVDECDYVSVTALGSWYAMWNEAKGGFYAVRHHTTDDGKDRLLYMHRFILGLKYGDPREGDHIHRHLTLDNRRYNLRIATDQEQQRHKGKYKSNTSGYKGVTKSAAPGSWVAYISINGKSKNLGSRKTPEEAYALYCAAAKELHGEFVCLE